MKESLRKAHGTYMDHWRRLQPLRGRRVSAAEPRCGECRMARIHLRLGLVLEHGVNSDQASFPSARLLAIVLRILADPRLYTTFSRLQASVHVGCAASKLHLAVARSSRDARSSVSLYLHIENLDRS
ncbi:hypothetical protein MPTK1_1g00770 [Marchantia polymorpha subsp. ruderalis]|uniref:Uncharacterized protein n=2 Tax=Marchantia polymorpha TaxID=3197 RepID=A0AAF6AK22_MARPO|nr:hypothetical protein MARPO_0103s0012 [Marchantia polymorpha]BBM96792.1 hypothetical protein Mp_1g00770 [Marchantia polymorpha subsp. ruderalis]|eukprot:PTQ32038.1 hypothetical protein MARPO_0103s0012 [Marchantia polymorpha]